ncbi:hypothetical protein KY284_023173 [Solanum tuberosum]|nr:hypothetical protein KY284_023173 [Solanum tuberosum]
MDIPKEKSQRGSNTNVETHALFEEIIETKIDVGDISDILLQADKSDTNDSPIEGANCTWFCLHPTTHDMTLAHPSVNDGQRSSHKSGFRQHIGVVYFYYLVGSAKRPDSTFFFLASTELVFTKGFLVEKDHVLSVKRRESYNADGLLVSAPYADVHEDAKHSLENDSKLPWTYHTICHVYRQCDCCYKEAVLSETNCSTAWSPLSSLICTHNK